MTATVTAPETGMLFAFADELLEKAAHTLWPRTPVMLGEHVPSVTGYVRHVQVGGQDLFAKLSVLGVSLVSALRGTCGTFEAVGAAQAAYRASPDALLEREAGQLGLLAAAGLRAAHVAGYADGVLFTEPVEGPTPGDLIAAEPHHTARLMTAVRRELRLLQRSDVVERVARISHASLCGCREADLPHGPRTDRQPAPGGRLPGHGVRYRNVHRHRDRRTEPRKPGSLAAAPGCAVADEHHPDPAASAASTTLQLLTALPHHSISLWHDVKANTDLLVQLADEG